MGIAPLAKVARPEGSPKVVMLTNDQNHLFPFPLVKNRDADQSKNSKIPGTDRSRPPKGYNKNLRDAADGSEANTEGNAIRSLPKVLTEGCQESQNM